MLKAGFLRCPAESALRLLGEALKRAGVIHGQVGQNLAVQFHACFLQPVDELVVAEPVQSGGRGDADYPQRAELALLLASSGEGKLQAAVDGFLGGPVKLRFGEEISSIFLRLARRLVPRFTRGMVCSFLCFYLRRLEAGDY